MYAAANAVDPDGCYEVARSSTARCGLPGTRWSASFTTRTTSPAARPTRTPTRWPGPALPPQRRRHRDRAADVRLRPGGRGQAARAAPAAVLRSHGRRVPVAGGGARLRVPRRPGAAQRPRAASRLAGGDRRLRSDQRDGGAHPRQRAAARGRRVSGRAWYATDRAAGRHRPVDRSDDGRACDPRDRPRARPAGGRRLDSLRVSDHRGEPGRRLPARPPAAGAGDPGVHRLGLEYGDRSDPRAARDRGLRPAAGRAAQRAGTGGGGRPDRIPSRDRHGQRGPRARVRRAGRGGRRRPRHPVAARGRAVRTFLPR